MTYKLKSSLVSFSLIHDKSNGTINVVPKNYDEFNSEIECLHKGNPFAKFDIEFKQNNKIYLFRSCSIDKLNKYSIHFKNMFINGEKHEM